ncbi:MAG: Gfo/Idh/MocA family oxidoreductase [Flavobacteriaceae bacterium]|nr:Gfo/Idh/MocA family oxidoreductase [Flavobacteriaceae bacterium]
MKNIALIGIGKMGLSHFAIANSTKGLNIVSVCDTSKSLLRAISKNLGIKSYHDYNKMLNAENLDGVIISVPNSMHFNVVKDCLAAGIHVFIEKPLTINYHDSVALQTLAKTKNCLVQVGFVNRFNLIFSKVKELLESNLLGDVQSYHCEMRGGVILEKNTKGWRNSYAAGGGCLYDFGPHCIDLAIFLFGDDVELKSSNLESVFSSQVDDRVHADFLHKNGVEGIISIDWSDPSVRKATNLIRVKGTFGELFANKQEIKINLNHASNNLGFNVGEHEIYVTDLNTNVDYYLRGEDFSLQMQEFSKSLNDNSTINKSFIDSVITTDRLIAEILAQNGVENG